MSVNCTLCCVYISFHRLPICSYSLFGLVFLLLEQSQFWIVSLWVSYANWSAFVTMDYYHPLICTQKLIGAMEVVDATMVKFAQNVTSHFVSAPTNKLDSRVLNLFSVLTPFFLFKSTLISHRTHVAFTSPFLIIRLVARFYLRCNAKCTAEKPIFATYFNSQKKIF